MVVQAYILVQTNVGKAAEVAARHWCHPRRNAGGRCDRSLRRHRARRSIQCRRARPVGSRTSASGAWHHPHGDLPVVHI
jgi:hypothetical protein